MHIIIIQKKLSFTDIATITNSNNKILSNPFTYITYFIDKSDLNGISNNSLIFLNREEIIILINKIFVYNISSVEIPN